MRRKILRGLIFVGVPIAALSALLAVRLAWEQTVWSWERGPQMVGFSLAHGGGAMLFLILLGGLLWLAAMLVQMAIARSLGGRFGIAVVCTYLLAWAVISIPYGYWQRLFVGKLAHGAHAAEFVRQAAAQGDLPTVEAFVAEGVSVNARNREGATALHAAAVGGQLAVAQYLVSHGADVNAIDGWGDSPMEKARSEGQAGVANFLRDRGGVRVRGSKDQRDKLAAKIVRDDMESSRSRDSGH